MAAMDDLKELCEHGSETIEVARDWELLSQARELLIYHGYVEQEQQTRTEEEEAQACIIFHRPDSSPKASFRFPEKAPDPQYKSYGNRTSSSITGWTLVKSFQHDTKQLPSNEQISIIAEIPKLNLEQIVGIRMVVQPYVMLDNAHFNVRLQVQRLVVGVHSDGFRNPEKLHQELGFYPYCIRLDMEPLVEGYDNLCAIPILETPVSPQNCFPENYSSFRTTSTTVGCQIGYGPALLNTSRTWGSQEAGGKKVEVVRINEAEGGNTASFEWSILRWASNEKYEAQKPDRGFKWNNGNLQQLPFKGCAVSLENEIPDVWWKLEREMVEKVVKFRIRLQAEMHLMWWRKNSFIRSKEILVDSFKYENVWELPQR